MVMESKTTSKTSCLKALLLRAWRERWTDLQWGINIKTVLPRGVSGDVYNLADCILQQAVVGAGANQLVLSYLRHSLSAQLVSPAAVLQRLSKYNQFSKVHCVFSLLEFLEGMLSGITCCGKPEEIVLATALLSIAHWLVSILQQCKSTPSITQKASELVKILLTEDFYVSMMCLARYNDSELFSETNRKCVELNATLLETDEVKQYIQKLETIDVNTLRLPVFSEPWPGSLIQCWLEVKLIGSPGSSTTVLAEQLQIFQRLKGYDDARLQAELIRGSLLSLYTAFQTSQESMWGAFTFLKVPHLLSQLAGKSDISTVVNAVELILQHSPLLDAMDANSSSSSLKCLLDELQKIRLLSEGQVKHLVDKRPNPPVLKLENGPASNGMPNYWHICADSTLQGILKTLCSDYHKVQEGVLGMFHQVLTGKSFELILAVAAVQGQLHTLVNRLIRFNEYSTKSGGDKVRTQLFDITFVMLIAIVQNYGVTNVLDTNGDSLFEQWCRSCMVERQKPKAPDQILKLCDPTLTDQLLEQFNAGESEFKPAVKWQDVIFNVPGVMHEVLVAWEQGALVPLDVKRILESLRGKMCCLTLAAVAWLCSYMHTAPQDSLLKPMNMIQQLLAAPSIEEDSLRDRWQLTSEIIRKMQRDVQLPLPTKSNHHLVSRQPATEQLSTCWSFGINRGWLDNASARTLHCLLDTAGSRWLVSAAIQELLKLRYRDQLQRGVDLTLAIFHVDIVNCTLQLLSHILPQLLYNDLQADSLMEPQLPALAYLTSYCVYAAWDTISNELEEEPVAKVKRLSDFSEDMKVSDQLVNTLHQLLNILDNGIQEGFITQQTYFAFYFLKSLVEVKTSNASTILTAVPRSLVSDLLKTLPHLFSYPLLLHLHDVLTTSGRINMAKDLCILRNYILKQNSSS